jgi:hemolysin activation/secretion protein
VQFVRGGIVQSVIGKFVIAGLAVCVLQSTLARAQTASQVTPPSFRPNLERGGGFGLPGAPGLTAPAGAEKLFVRLKNVKIEGGRPELAAATEALEARVTGRQVSAADIFAAARELEAAYVSAGFMLVRVILPPQKLVNGATLRLVIVDGYIERIDTQGVPERVRPRISAVAASLVGKRGITLREIERRLLLAGDTPGVILRSTLSAGKEQGAAVLVLEGRYQPVTAQATFDNTLSAALGRWIVGAGLDVNSVTGLGELLYLRAAGYPSTGGDDGLFKRRPRNRTLAAGVVVPLGLDGLSFNIEATDARTTPLATNGIQTASEFDRASFRLRYPWVRSRDLNLNSEVAYDAQDEKQLLNVAGDYVALSLDRLRVLRFNNDGNYIAPWGGLFAGRITPSFGLSGLGARSAADATALLPLSRQGADANFQKLEAFVSYSQTLIDHLAVDLRVRAQTSFNKPLLRSEQFGIAYAAGLSSFDAGSLQGDSGYVVRGEIQSPWFVPITSGAFVLAPYVFGAKGEVHLVNPTAVEVPTIQASSYGAGLRFGGSQTGTFANANVTFEYGRQIRDDGIAGGNRFNVIGALQF